MLKRFSSRKTDLGADFLTKRLQGAVSYDRIAGYFCSSVLEIAGETMEQVRDKIRVVCNSGLSADDVRVAALAKRGMKQEWCDYQPEEAFSSLPAHDALYAAPQGEPDSWIAHLPDVDSLRAVYVAAKRAAPMGIERVSLSDIEREVARVGGLDDDILVQAALAVLDHMGLAVVDRAAARLTLPPPKKSDPTEDQLFRRLQRLRDFALGPAAAPARD